MGCLNIKTPSYEYTLHWRHNGSDSVSNHQLHDCFLNRLFRRRSKKTSKLHVTGLCAGNSPETGEFPAQMASNAENVSIWWRHHGFLLWRSHNRVVIIMRICIIMVVILQRGPESQCNPPCKRRSLEEWNRTSYTDRSRDRSPVQVCFLRTVRWSRRYHWSRWWRCGTAPPSPTLLASVDQQLTYTQEDKIR